MTQAVLSSPFGTEPIEEVVLDRSPLVRVLAQVRIPGLVLMSGQHLEGTVDRVVTALGTEYPILTTQHEMQLTITPEGVQQAPGQRIWQLRSGDERWQITLGETFIALECRIYGSRHEFIDRLSAALAAFRQTVSPPYAERLGVRYINRIDETEQLLRLDQLVRPEVLGGLAVPRPDGVALAHMMSESMYSVGSRWLHARWGLLPAGAMLDPTIPPRLSSSWVLDLDSFTQERLSFDNALPGVAAELASNAYRYFRWVVTTDFLTTFGGRS